MWGGPTVPDTRGMRVVDWVNGYDKANEVYGE